MKIAEFEGPGQMVTAHSDVNGVQVELNSEDPTSSVTYPSRAHDHQAFLFSAPGVYRVVFAYSGVGVDGTAFTVPLETFFSVGNDATSPSDPAHPDPVTGGAMPILDFAKELDGVISQVNKDVISLNTSLTTIEKISDKWFGGATMTVKGSPSRPAASHPGADNAQQSGGQPAHESAALTSAVNHPVIASLSTGAAVVGGSNASGDAVASAATSLGVPVIGETAASAELDSAGGTDGSGDGSVDAAEEGAQEGEASGEGLGIRALPSDSAQTEGAANDAQHSTSTRAEKGKLAVLAQNLQQGGWLGGFTLGVGLMALLGGMLLVLLATRNLRAAQELVRNQRAQRAGEGAD